MTWRQLAEYMRTEMDSVQLDRSVKVYIPDTVKGIHQVGVDVVSTDKAISFDLEWDEPILHIL